jgi:hypothetical protein
VTWLDDLTLETVIVHIRHGGASLRGLKEAVYDDGILLRDVVNLDVEPLTVEAGTHFIPREQVERLVLLTGAA